MKSGRAVYVAEAVRTPVGRRGGGLAGAHPADLAGHVIKAAVDRCGIDPGAVGDVVLGCVNSLGAQTGNIARISWLSAGLPEHVPGVTVDRRCGSGQQAVEFAAQGIAAGVHEVVVAGGVEVMSLVPMGSPASVGDAQGFGAPYGARGWAQRYGHEEMSQFQAAELVAERWGISRAEMEEFALRSHLRAVGAQHHGLFDREIVPVEGITLDEGPRAETSLVRMAELPLLLEGGRMTAAVSSQISDGAAAAVLVSEGAVERFNLQPLARLVAGAVVGSDPVEMLTGPIPATARVLMEAGLGLDDIDLFEVNEAFASVVLAWAGSTGADLNRTNVNGGAIALGHPLGASGARILATLVHELARRGGRFGLQVMCEGGGTANALVVESLPRAKNPGPILRHRVRE